MPATVIRARDPAEVEAAKALVREFFDFVRDRYPDMQSEIDDYMAAQDVAGQLDSFAAHFLPPAGECFLALLHGTAAGIVLLKPLGDGEGEVNRMYVRAPARGQGLGRQLGEALLAEARDRGMRRLRLNALYRHVEALPLYESLGFVRYADPAGFRADDERVIHMKLDL